MLRYPSQMAFLAVQTRVWQLNRWPCHSLADSLTHWVSVLISPSKSDPRHLWPFRHLIRVMRRHDPTKKFELFWNFLGKAAKKRSRSSKSSKLSRNCQVMSLHHSDQMSQRSQVSRVALCKSKSKGGSVTQWVTGSPIELSDSCLDS